MKENTPSGLTPITLADLPKGSLFKHGNTLALKTEYRTNRGAIEAFIVGSGEMFWGGTNTAQEQGKLLVIPIPDYENYCKRLETLWRDIDLIIGFDDLTERRRLADIETKIIEFNKTIKL